MDQNLERKYYLYLAEKMTTEEKLQFENEIDQDSDKKKDLENYRLAILAGERLQYLEIKERVVKLRKEEQGKRKRRNKRNLFIGILIALGSLIALLFFILNKPNPEPRVLMAQYYEAPPFSGKKGIENDVSTVDLAQSAFAAKNWNRVQALLDNLPLVELNNPLPQELKAHAFLSDNQPDKAIPIFKNLLINADSAYQIEYQWYLALSFLYENEMDSTRVYLNKVGNSPRQSIFTTKAKKLINKLD